MAMDPFLVLFTSNVITLFLWGFYSSIFILTMSVMRQRNAGFKPAVGIICFLYALNFAGSVCQIYESLPNMTVLLGGQDETWANINTSAINAIADFTLFLSIISADSMMVWRMWIIWGKDWRVVVLPAILLTIGLVGGCFIVAYDAMGVQYHVNAYLTLSESMLAGTAALNILVTAMTAGRLWWVSRKVRGMSSTAASRYSTLISAVVEGGLLYTVCALIFTILLHVDLNARLIFQGFFVYTIGIAPTLILLKLSLGYLQPGDTMNSNSALPSTYSTTKSGSRTAPNSTRRRDDLTCDLSDLDSMDNTDSMLTATKTSKSGAYDLHNSQMKVYIDTKEKTEVV